MNKLSDYEIGKPIGKGKFGQVYLGRLKTTKEKVAIKSISKEQIKKSKVEYQIQRELDILSIVEHENVILLVDHFEDEERIYIVTEYCEGGNLYEKIENGKKLDETIVVKYIMGLSQAVNYLHSNNIIHRDIKPENLVLTIDNNVKLCDFGWSVITQELRTTLCGTIDYLPPEIVDSESYDQTVDLWNIGVLTYELLTGELPFVDKTYRGTYENISNVRVEYPEYLSDGAKDFMKSLLVRNPSDRLKPDKIMDHPWIKSYKN